MQVKLSGEEGRTNGGGLDTGSAGGPYSTKTNES